jgi:MFS family permease
VILTSAAAPRSPSRAVLAGGAGVVVCTLPVFLTGALSTDLGAELSFSAAQLGLAVALFKATGAVSSAPLGRVADRLGATVSLHLSIGAAGLACIGIAAASGTWTALVAWLVLAALGKSLSQPAANRLLSRNVPAKHQGIAFGVKQSAAPLASMLAGISVPLVALAAGWRAAFFATAALGALAMLLVGRRSRPAGRQVTAVASQGDGAGGVTVAVLGVAFGLSSIASATIPVFFVPAAFAGGLSAETGGVVLAAASLAAILTRIALGAFADRLTRGHLYICSILLGLGAAGLALLAVGGDALLPVAAVVALAGAWGFNGVFWYSLVRLRPATPGKITGAVAPAGMIGGVIGPGAMGAVSEIYSYSAGWWMLCVSTVLSTGVMAVGARRAELGR